MHQLPLRVTYKKTVGWTWTCLRYTWEHFVEFAKPTREQSLEWHTRNHHAGSASSYNPSTTAAGRWFFKPLQTYYERFIDRWLWQHPGRTFTEYQVAEAFHKAFRKAGTVATAQHAFAVCGIWPLNPDIFSDADYAASTMTDQSILLENSRRSAGRPKPKLTILYLTFF